MPRKRIPSAPLLVSCARFKPTLIIAFFYACLAPLTIWLRMRSGAFYWIGNDTAFCFFMLFIFPFAVSVFACVFQPFLLMEALKTRSRRLIPMAVFAIGLCVLGQGVKDDMSPPVGSPTQVQRLRQPYMVRDDALMWQLDKIHRSAFADNSMTTSKQQYISVLTPHPDTGKSAPRSHNRWSLPLRSSISSTWALVSFFFATLCFWQFRSQARSMAPLAKLMRR